MKARLYGYFGRGNLGDEAILAAWQEAVPTLRRAEVASPPGLPWGRKITLFAGGILQDRTSLRSLAWYAGAIRMAARAGPCALAAVGADVRSEAGRAVLGWALSPVRFVSGRDPESCRTMRLAGGDAAEARDVALTLCAPRHRGGGSVLVNLTHAVPPPIRRSVVAAARDAARTLRTEARGLVSARGEDEPALEGLPLVRPGTSAELLRVLASAALVIAARLHVLELALLCRTPFVAVPWTDKCLAFLRLVERELPCPAPRLPSEAPQGWLSSIRWSKALERARERLVMEAWMGVSDVQYWLRSTA